MRASSAIVAGCLAALVWMVATALPYVSLPDTWKGTHWLFRLEDGILRRALAGSLLGGLQGDAPISLHTITIVSVGTCALFAVAFSTAIARYLHDTLPARSSGKRLPWLGSLTLVYFASAPGGLRQHLADMGRFDVLGATIILLGLLLTFRGIDRAPESLAPASPSWWTKRLPLFMALSAAAILFHEAFAFWVVPLLWLVWWWHCDRSRQAVCAGLLGLTVLGMLTLLAWTFDYGRVMPLDEARRMLAARAGFTIADPSLMIHFRDLTTNAYYTQARAWTGQRLIGLVLAGTVLLPQVTILAALLRMARRSHTGPSFPPPSLLWFLGASFSPLALTLVGHDQGRWLAMSSFTVTCLSLSLWASVRRAGMIIPRWLITLMLVTTVWQVVSGPFGITRAMPVHPLSALLQS